MSAMERTSYCGAHRSNAWRFEEPQDYSQHGYSEPRSLAGVSPNEPLPLFLSEVREPDQHEPDQQEFVCLKASRWPSIFGRFCGLVVSIIALLAAAYNSDIRSAIIDKSKILISDAAENRVAVQPSAAASPPRSQAETSAGAPERGDHATLLGQQSPVLGQHPPALNLSEAGVLPSSLDAKALASLTKRAKDLLAVGDIAAARLLLERVANEHDATAAFLLGQTYDPTVLGVADQRSITADPAMARDWYRKAASLGSANAQRRLAQIPN
jgi:hypothetical protein